METQAKLIKQRVAEYLRNLPGSLLNEGVINGGIQIRPLENETVEISRFNRELGEYVQIPVSDALILLAREGAVVKVAVNAEDPDSHWESSAPMRKI